MAQNNQLIKQDFILNIHNAILNTNMVKFGEHKSFMQRWCKILIFLYILFQVIRCWICITKISKLFLSLLILIAFTWGWMLNPNVKCRHDRQSADCQNRISKQIIMCCDLTTTPPDRGALLLLSTFLMTCYRGCASSNVVYKVWEKRYYRAQEWDQFGCTCA